MLYTSLVNLCVSSLLNPHVIRSVRLPQVLSSFPEEDVIRSVWVTGCSLTTHSTNIAEIVHRHNNRNLDYIQ